MKKLLQKWLRSWLGLSPKQPVPIKGIVRTGHAEIVRDTETGGMKWHTFDFNDDVGYNMVINENLVFPPTAFKVGTRIEIFEDIG